MNRDCDCCEKVSCITIFANNKNYNYCGNCYFKNYNNTKITINNDEIHISHQIPILVFISFSYYKITHIYTFFRHKTCPELLQIIDKEGTEVNEEFSKICVENCVDSGCITRHKTFVDDKMLNSIILKYKNFEKIISIKDKRIKYITYDEIKYQ